MNVLDFCLNLVAPQVCRGCNLVGSGLCLDCKNNITDETYTHCPLCGKTTSGGLCISCRKISACDQIFVVGGRKDSLKTLINDYKFNSARSLSKDITDLLDKTLPILPNDTVVISIPTIPSHIRQRGFDHAKLIAKNLAKRRKLRYDGRLLLRQTNSVQIGASVKQRKNQADKAFRLNLHSKIPKNILLVDDILTTGSTILAASKLLKSAGAKTVNVAVVARQELNDVLK